MIPHVIVVGAGAAGLVAAIAAREAGARVTLVESTSDGGRKILISGGGRCNVLPSESARDRFVSDAPRGLVRSMLGGWPLRDQRRFFEVDLRVPLALEAASGKLFPVSNRARDVRDGLVFLATERGVDVRFRWPVVDIRPRPQGGWRVASMHGGIHADRVVVAAGGLSVPTTGSTGFGFELARRLGHIVHPPYPALTPLRAEPAIHTSLAGVSINVSIDAVSARGRARATGGFLFTHRGYSGPAVLDVSHVATRSPHVDADRAIVTVCWADMNEQAWSTYLSAARGRVTTAVGWHLPQRLADALVQESGIEADRPCAHLRREERVDLVKRLTAYELPWTGDEGYRTAEVTGGGVALDEVHRGTLESKRSAGLHFCGEALDAFGPIGGHNFQWAWSTGRIAGLGAAQPAPGEDPSLA